MQPLRNVDPETIDRLYHQVRRIRRVEEEIARVYPTDRIKSPVHLSIGQEAAAVGVCDVLAPDDVVAPTYRCHAAYLAKGGDLRAMIAELYGRDTGCARGKGGSMHLAALGQGVLGASAVVGTTIPVAVGYALAIRRRGERRVVVAYLGDGATEEGVFYESLNFAALHRLPVLFVCENNGYAIHTPTRARWAQPDLCARVAGFGVVATRIEDGDIIRLRRAAEEAVAGLRRGSTGPVLIECAVYRWREHVGPGEDYDAGYRDRDELAPWTERDPMTRLAKWVPAVRRTAIDAAIESEIAEAFAFAETSPWPGPEELTRDVFAG